ncbi:hypothetical protein BpHYR1_033740 [Brachionus plicatilis]|uniref:Endonuclease/exonuclease/phosphatase domain-containing protein n=1 Tax=Brachionus plicatilis TaxID=10195 RepID=A0A3M7T2P1_BRAPC|nr:hypothetical protein BpHYR1_033740 [Brachionus plicatilis]
MQNDLNRVQSNVNNLQEDVNIVQRDLNRVQSDISKIQRDITTIDFKLEDAKTTTLDELKYIKAILLARRDSKVGRAAGGLAFIIDNNLEYSHKFYGHRIGKITIGCLTILNVYLTYNNGTMKNDDDFLSELLLLHEIIQEDKNSKQFVIIGDFNAHPMKINRLTKELFNFFTRNSLTMRDIYTSQSVDFTYLRLDKNGRQLKSWIDHCVTQSRNTNIREAKILISKSNLGEHKANSTEYISKNESITIYRTEAIKLKLSLKWHNQNELTLTYELKQLKQETDKSILKTLVTKMINELSYALIDATKKTHNEKLNNKRKKNGSKIKRNSWWYSTIQELHNVVVQKYLEYRSSNFDSNLKKDFTEAKRNFRERKRYNLKLQRNRSLRIIDALFCLNKQDFWKQIKPKLNDPYQVDIDIQRLVNDYAKMFNNQNPVEHSTMEAAKNGVVDYLENHENTVFNFKIYQKTLRDIVGKLPNGKSVGFCWGQ